MDVISILQPGRQTLSEKVKHGKAYGGKPFSNHSRLDTISFSGAGTARAAGRSEFAVGSFVAGAAPFRQEPVFAGDVLLGAKNTASAESVSGRRAGAFSLPRFGGERIPRFSEESRESAEAPVLRLPFFGAYAAALALLLAAFCVFAPFMQNRFGFYRLEKFDFPDDAAAASAMNARLGGDYVLAAERAQGGDSLPEILLPVAYSDYTVRGGDTVSAVALRFGLNNISTILSVNGIENARRIRSGQRLRIPSIDGILYTVAAGDSVASVAERFGVPLSDILDVNDLSDDVLRAGQELFIPGARMSAYDLRKAMGELFIYPIRGRLTSRFGSRADPFTGVRSFHTGVDLAAPTGTSVKVSTDGRVSDAGWQNVFGNYVIVTHAGGYQTLYAHLSRISVRRGQYLTQGEEVGKVGSTGYSTGPHLHFSVYKNGKMIDPFSVLD